MSLKKLSTLETDSSEQVSSLTDKCSSLEGKLESLEDTLQQRDNKIKHKSSTIEQLMTKLETERNGYEIALLGQFVSIFIDY